MLCLCFVSLSKQEQATIPRTSRPRRPLSFSLSNPTRCPTTSSNLSAHLSPPLLPSPSRLRSSTPWSRSSPSPSGLPPQTQDMILDTRSYLSWIQCHVKAKKKSPSAAAEANTAVAGQPSSSATTFDPYLSSSFSVLPYNHPLCKPRAPDLTLPTSCDQNRLCYYSYLHVDCTLAVAGRGDDVEVEPRQGGAEG